MSGFPSDLLKVEISLKFDPWLMLMRVFVGMDLVSETSCQFFPLPLQVFV